MKNIKRKISSLVVEVRKDLDRAIDDVIERKIEELARKFFKNLLPSSVQMIGGTAYGACIHLILKNQEEDDVIFLEMDELLAFKNAADEYGIETYCIDGFKKSDESTLLLELRVAEKIMQGTLNELNENNENKSKN